MLTEVLPSEISSASCWRSLFVRNIKGVKRTAAARSATPRRPSSRRTAAACVVEHERAVKAWRRRPTAASSPARATTVKVWRDGARERTIVGARQDANWINAVAVLPGGARFVSVSEDGTAKLWTLDGALERTFEVGNRTRAAASRRCPTACTLWSDLASPARSGCTTSTGRSSTPSRGTPTLCVAVAVTPDGQHIISGSEDKLVKVWSVAGKSLVSTCAGHTSTVRAVAAMPDGQRILSGGDNTVRVWRLNGTLENTFELHAPTG